MDSHDKKFHVSKFILVSCSDFSQVVKYYQNLTDFGGPFCWYLKLMHLKTPRNDVIHALFLSLSFLLQQKGSSWKIIEVEGKDLPISSYLRLVQLKFCSKFAHCLRPV